ncbi:unnamed protein product [Protopolystoma xenopodis]|uniref:Uncharacterized protein n=1 Tax=Protopolystoma xenopodis TaxID=117903 RepID=A0A3S5AFW4_9PLAT|nr:unnamed protein product [Protopolystoma xenopodis]
MSTTSENSLACLLQFFDQQLRRLIESLECNGHHSLHTEKICLDVKDPLFLRRPDVADDEAMGLLDDEYGKEGEECGSYDGYLRQSQCLDTQHSDLWSGNGSPACFQSMPELSNKTIDHQDEIHRYIRFKGGVITI